MNSTITATSVACLLCLLCANAADDQGQHQNLPPDRIGLWQVPLVCPAATQIGCGSRSKPILLGLERQPPVAEAWLNRSGTIMAVVWKPESKRKDRTNAVKGVSKEEQIEMRELHGAARKEALASFLSGRDWLKGSDVDRLSEEEAGILAVRLVRRIQSLVSVSAEKATALQAEFTEAFKRQLTGAQEADETNIHTRLLAIARKHLDEADVALLQQSLPHNLRPLPGEQ
jgi:hypothetical protein